MPWQLTGAAIVDANVNRVSEGLRVIEDYARFCLFDSKITTKLADIRHQVNAQFSADEPVMIASRNVDLDIRARTGSPPRGSMTNVLIANFKRVTEGLRVLEEVTNNLQCNHFRYDIYQIEKVIMTVVNRPVIPRGIYVISDSVSILEEAVKRGAAIVQLRDKISSKADILVHAKDLRQRITTVPIIINDFLDIAIVCDADGFHSGQDDIPVHTVRKLWPSHKIVGRTTHQFADGIIAAEGGADYVSVGPIWETPSKPNRAGIGFDYLKKASELPIPYVAIGGITPELLGAVLAFQPPMVGIIRAHSQVEVFKKQFDKMVKDALL